MVRRILTNKKFLEYFLDVNSKQQKHLLKGASPEEINTLCEATYNVLNKNVPVDDQTKRKLRRHRNTISELTLKRRPISKRRKILIQRGGFLPIVLKAVLPILASALLSS